MRRKEGAAGRASHQTRQKKRREKIGARRKKVLADKLSVCLLERR